MVLSTNQLYKKILTGVKYLEKEAAIQRQVSNYLLQNDEKKIETKNIVFEFLKQKFKKNNNFYTKFNEMEFEAIFFIYIYTGGKSKLFVNIINVVSDDSKIEFTICIKNTEYSQPDKIIFNYNYTNKKLAVVLSLK